MLIFYLLGDHASYLLIIPNFYSSNKLGLVLTKMFVPIGAIMLIYLTIKSVENNYDMDISFNIATLFISNQVGNKCYVFVFHLRFQRKL